MHRIYFFLECVLKKDEKSKFNRGLPFPATIRLLNFEKKPVKKSQMLLLKNKLLRKSILQIYN